MDIKEVAEKIANEVFLVDSDPDKEKYDKIRMVLGDTYEDIISVLKDYCDLKEEHYKLIAIWIIGTYFYKEFLTFPFLFFNAMRGSGKSRLLRLITTLAWNGSLITSPTESVLFRSAGQGTLGIDEFESIAKRENQGLREILNASYKKGMTIKRMRKKKTMDGETQVVEEFQPYCPIVMANIWGMEDVLGDRCITLIIEKSNNPVFSKKAENFESSVVIKNIKLALESLKTSNLASECILCSYFAKNNIYTEWNNWINITYNHTNTLTTLTTLTTQTTLTKNIKLDEFFLKIDKSDVNGRDLELFMPLFMVAKFLHEDILEEIIEFAKQLTKEKREEQMTESRDVQVFDFISTLDEKWFYNIKQLTDQFRHYIGYVKEDEFRDWCNPKWFGRALKRLELIREKKRQADGFEVSLNIKKAKDKMKMF